MAAYKRYKVIDKVQDPDYTQWLDGFVQKALRKGKVNVDSVEIYDIEPSKRIFLRAGDREFTIRTWNFAPWMYDRDGVLCGEAVDFTLFEDVWDDEPGPNGLRGGHGEKIADGTINIMWDPKKLKKAIVSIKL